MSAQPERLEQKVQVVNCFYNALGFLHLSSVFDDTTALFTSDWIH